MLTKLIIEKLNQSLHCNLTEAIEYNFSDLLMHWKTHTHKNKTNKPKHTPKTKPNPTHKTTTTKKQNHKRDSEKGFQNVCQAFPPWADHHH